MFSHLDLKRFSRPADVLASGNLTFYVINTRVHVNRVRARQRNNETDVTNNITSRRKSVVPVRYSIKSDRRRRKGTIAVFDEYGFHNTV